MIADCDVAAPLRVQLTAWPATELSTLVDANDAVVVCTRVSGERNAVHTVVRDIVFSTLHALPGQTEIAYTSNGKPYLAGPNPALKFNLSHSGGVLLVGLSRASEIGVDVERIRSIPDWRRIANRVFDAGVCAQLLAEIACGGNEDDVFIRHWCRMEAAVKSTGEGVFGRDAAIDPTVARTQPRVIDLPDLPLPAGDARYRAALALCP